MHRTSVPWLSGPPLRQLEELAAWGEGLEDGKIVSLTADEDQVDLEGSYWLALLKEPAFPVPESQVWSLTYSIARALALTLALALALTLALALALLTPPLLLSRIPCTSASTLQVQASDLFEAGWLVVKAQWFQVVTTSPRCYKLQKEERLLVVNSMIRLSGLKFEKVVKRSPRLGDSQYFLSEDTHNMIEACVRDQAD